MGASATFMMIVTSAPWITKSITSGLGRGSQWATHGANSKRKFHSLPRLEAHHTYGLHGDGMQRVRSLALWCFSPTACLQGSCKLWASGFRCRHQTIAQGPLPLLLLHTEI